VWIRKILNDVTRKQFLLLVDQWSIQTNISTYEGNFAKGQSGRLMIIPRKITSTRQSCDQYFFRQWEKLVRRIYHCVLIDDLNIDSKTRDSIIKLQSLVHNQLCADVFVPMISYSWSTSGYYQQKYQSFLNLNDVRFSFKAD